MANEKFQILSVRILSEIIPTVASGDVSNPRFALVDVRTDEYVKVNSSCRVLVQECTLVACIATLEWETDAGCHCQPLTVSQIFLAETNNLGFQLESIETGLFSQYDFCNELQKSIQAKAAEMGLREYCGETTTEPWE